MTYPPETAKRLADNELVDAIRSGEEEAVEEQLLALRHGFKLIAAGLLNDSASAEEVAQSATYKFVRYVRDAGRAIRNPHGLAITIVRNRCYDLLRKKSTASERISLESLKHENGSTMEFADQKALRPDEIVEREEAVTRLRRAMAELEPRQRAVMRALYWEGQSLKEVAKVLGVTTRTVYNIRERALALLGDLLE